MAHYVSKWLNWFFESRFSTHAGWLMSGGAVKAFVSFGSGLVLMRLLSPSDFGRFAFVESNIGLVGALVNFRTPEVVLQAPKDEVDNGLLGRIGAAVLLESLLVGGVSVLLLVVLGIFDANAMILLAGALAVTWALTVMRLCERKFDYARVSMVEVSAQIIAYGSAVLAALWGFGEVVLYVRSALYPALLLAGLYCLGETIFLPVRWLSAREWGKLLRRVSGFWGDSVLEQSFRRIVIIFAGSLLNEAATGIIFQARRLARVPSQLLTPVTNRLILNQFSRSDPLERRRYLNISLAAVGITLSLVSAGVWTLADPVIPFVLGEDWRPAVLILQLMVGFIVGYSVINIFKVYYMSINKMKKFLAYGRGAQYISFFFALGIFSYLDVNMSIGLSIALSVAYIGGSATAFFISKEK